MFTTHEYNTHWCNNAILKQCENQHSFVWAFMHVLLASGVHEHMRSGGGVVDNTLDYQSRGRKIDPPLLRSFG